MTNNGQAKAVLGDPYPIRFSPETEVEINAAIDASGLDKANVLRLALNAGLPIITKQFAPQIARLRKARRVAKQKSELPKAA